MLTVVITALATAFLKIGLIFRLVSGYPTLLDFLLLSAALTFGTNLCSSALPIVVSHHGIGIRSSRQCIGCPEQYLKIQLLLLHTNGEQQ